MSGVRYEPNTDAALADVAIRAGLIAETGAELLRDEIKSRIDLDPTPSEPGHPPHSRGPYRDSWKASAAKRRGDAVVAYAYSTARRSDGGSLAIALEYGEHTIPLAPRPHVRPAIGATTAKLRAVVNHANRRQP